MAFKITAELRVAPQPTIDVPAELAAELKELYAFLEANPQTCGHGTFDTDDEKANWITYARAWSTQNGLVFRQLKSSKLPGKELRFTIKPPKDEDAAPATPSATPKAPAKDAAK
jgi:hypothetical protein